MIESSDSHRPVNHTAFSVLETPRARRPRDVRPSKKQAHIHAKRIAYEKNETNSSGGEYDEVGHGYHDHERRIIQPYTRDRSRAKYADRYYDDDLYICDRSLPSTMSCGYYGCILIVLIVMLVAVVAVVVWFVGYWLLNMTDTSSNVGYAVHADTAQSSDLERLALTLSRYANVDVGDIIGQAGVRQDPRKVVSNHNTHNEPRTHKHIYRFTLPSSSKGTFVYTIDESMPIMCKTVDVASLNVMCTNRAGIRSEELRSTTLVRSESTGSPRTSIEIKNIPSDLEHATCILTLWCSPGEHRKEK